MTRPLRALAFLLAVLTVGVLSTGPAAAHTGFESSDPTDGATVGEPVDIVTLTFTGQAEPTGGGFQVLDATGVLREPDQATTDDGLTWTLRFDPALAGGTIGVRWEVKAPDAHPIAGSFSFTVTAPLPTPIQPSEPESASSTLDDEPVASPDAALEAFLETDAPPTVDPARVGASGRILTLAGTLVGVGALVFAAAVLRGDHRDVRHVLHWVRRSGLLAVLGAVIELVAQIAIEGGGDWAAVGSPGTVGDVVVSTFGIAVALRIAGGWLLASGSRFDIAYADDVADPVVALKELVGVGAARAIGAPDDLSQPRTIVREPYRHHGDTAWQPTIGSVGAVFGAIAVVAAHLFDGHTVTKGDRLWTAIADVVHVVGGAVWAGGVLMLAAVLWRRQRHGRDLRALQLAARFSVVATMALVAVGGAGVGLTVIVLDSPSELWTTEWGRTLMVKTALVATAAAAGAYNHYVAIPQLEAAPDDPRLARHFRAVITGEAVALVAVVVVTALLMGAAS